jgi:sorbitol/mannitol transport system substrate-binding protein
MHRRSAVRPLLLVSLALTCATASACSGAGGGGGSSDDSGGKSIDVIMVNNPQMTDLERLTEEYFTKETGITVNYTVQPENEVRAKIAQDFTSQAGSYDVATISNYEVPIFDGQGWLTSMTPYIEEDTDFDVDDIFPAMIDSLTGEDGEVYGMPFYGESSFLMYRKDVAEKANVQISEQPTWDEVADAAAKLDGAEPGMAGICLRGLPGWGEVFAPLTTVVNTFGGTWFTEDWEAGVDSPEFTEAVNFYVDLVREHGQTGAAQSGFAECLNAVTQSKAAMWYDATSAAGSLEAPDSPVKGKIAYVQAPVKETDASGWLYTWAWGIQAASENPDEAWEFISWASSKEYEELVGKELGWAKAPAGKRQSLYENEAYLKEAPFAEATLTALENADPTDPGTQPRPAIGIQFMAIPEFADLATGVSEGVSAAIAGRGSVEDALAEGQEEAQDVADSYK